MAAIPTGHPSGANKHTSGRPRDKELAQLFDRNIELAIERDKMSHDASLLNLILAYIVNEFAEGRAMLPDELETDWQCVIAEGPGNCMYVTTRQVESEGED